MIRGTVRPAHRSVHLAWPPAKREEGGGEAQVDQLPRALRKQRTRYGVIPAGKKERILSVLVPCLLVLRQGTESDPPRVGGVEALDVRRDRGERFRVVAGAATCLEDITEGAIGTCRRVFPEQRREGATNIGKRRGASLAPTGVALQDRLRRETGFPDEGPECVRVAVNELRAKLHRLRCSRRPNGVHSPPDPIARLEQDDAPTGSGQMRGRREPGHPCANDQHVRVTHDEPEEGRGLPYS